MATAIGLQFPGHTLTRPIRHAVEAGLVTVDSGGIGPVDQVEQPAA